MAGPAKGRETILKNDADSAWKSEIILACSTVLVQNPSGALCHPWNIRVPVVTLFGEEDSALHAASPAQGCIQHALVTARKQTHEHLNNPC